MAKNHVTKGLMAKLYCFLLSHDWEFTKIGTSEYYVCKRCDKVIREE